MNYKELAKSFLKEGRTKDITKRKFLEIYEENIGVNPEKLPKIYRGLDENYLYGYVKPAEYSRKSRNTSNYYTLIMDHSQKWKQYPKGSKSIICTTSRSKAENYGSIY